MDIIFSQNLTSDLIKQTALSKEGPITSCTLLNCANKTLRECKKIYSLVPEVVVYGYLEGPVHGRHSYPSGKNAVNLFHFIFDRIHNWDMYYGPSSMPLPERGKNMKDNIETIQSFQSDDEEPK